MKALALSSFDEPTKVQEVPEPTPGPGEVLVRVAAASVNAYDTFVAMGAARQYMSYEFPAVIGGDHAGTIEAPGEGAEGFAVGDRVFGMMGMKPAIHDGTFAELATPQAAAVASMPDGVKDVDAGSLGVAGTTAYSAVEAVRPGEGSKVLVVGATGGVGSFAVQLARLRGALVIATIRPGDEEFAADLGAPETVDYTGDTATDIRRRFPDGLDAVIDAVSSDAESFAAMAGLVRDGGHVASTRGAAGESTEVGGVHVSNANGNPGHLVALGELLAKGDLRVPVRRTYPLADAAKALEDFTKEHTVGKLVITM